MFQQNPAFIGVFDKPTYKLFFYAPLIQEGARAEGGSGSKFCPNFGRPSGPQRGPLRYPCPFADGLKALMVDGWTEKARPPPRTGLKHPWRGGGEPSDRFSNRPFSEQRNSQGVGEVDAPAHSAPFRRIPASTAKQSTCVLDVWSTKALIVTKKPGIRLPIEIQRNVRKYTIKARPAYHSPMPTD